MTAADMAWHNFKISNIHFYDAGQEEFTERDVEVFKRYLTFCGIGMAIKRYC